MSVLSDYHDAGQDLFRERYTAFGEAAIAVEAVAETLRRFGEAARTMVPVIRSFIECLPAESLTEEPPPSNPAVYPLVDTLPADNRTEDVHGEPTMGSPHGCV